MVSIKTKRFMLFFLGCIPMRLLFVYLIKQMPIHYLPYCGIIGIIIGLSFLWLYAFKNKTADSQLAWAGEPYIWWNKLRIIHGLLYISFGLVAIQKYRSCAVVILLVDVIIGLLAWINHHNILC